MDDETKAAFAKIDLRFDAVMSRLNDQFERVLDGLESVRKDHEAVRGHLLYMMQDGLTLSQRITQLEADMRKRGE